MSFNFDDFKDNHFHSLLSYFTCTSIQIHWIHSLLEIKRKRKTKLVRLDSSAKNINIVYKCWWRYGYISTTEEVLFFVGCSFLIYGPKIFGVKNMTEVFKTFSLSFWHFHAFIALLLDLCLLSCSNNNHNSQCTF